jgi:hypothetical protein
MKRDMDLVRNMLFKLAESDHSLDFEELLPEGSTLGSREIAAYHLQMLIEEAQLVRGLDSGHIGGRDWNELELTWQGHDFLDSVRDETVWAKSKEGAKKLGGVSFDLLLGLVKEVAKAEAKKRLGLEL